MKKAIKRVLRGLGKWEEIDLKRYKIQRYSNRDWYLVWDMEQGNGRGVVAGDHQLVAEELAKLIREKYC